MENYYPKVLCVHMGEETGDEFDFILSQRLSFNGRVFVLVDRLFHNMNSDAVFHSLLIQLGRQGQGSSTVHKHWKEP